MLYLIATPIGNLKDITVRSLEILQSVDIIICEDTRRATQLLNHYQIQKPLLALNDFNETKLYPQIIERLKNGEQIALTSDAGTPLVSDPGYKLVREAIKAGVEVDSLPGPVAAVTALTLSGLPPDKFYFIGFFPEKPGQRQTLYQHLYQIYQLQPTTFIAYQAPFKILKVLTELAELYPDMQITLAKELTKIYQQVKTKSIQDWITEFKKSNPRGEWVMLFRFD